MIRCRLALTAALLAAALPGAAPVGCAPDRLDIRGEGGAARFTIEVADDAEERAQGLMNRPEMALFHGMLFVYDAPQPVAFWMKDTMIPLDMLFADATGTVQRVQAMAEPYSTDGIPGGDAIQYVLEINGGLAEDLGLAPGAEMRHPAIDGPDAAWPCPEG